MPDNGSVDIIHNGNNGYGFGVLANESKRYQTFIAPPHCTGILGVWAKLRRVSGADFSFPSVELYATADNKPAGVRLARASLSPVGHTFELTWTSMSVSGLQPGTKYAIVLGGETFSNPSLNSRFEWAVAPVYSNLNFGRWNGTAWVDESYLGNGWLQIEVKYGDSVIDLSHDGTSGFTFGQNQDQLKRYQTFIARDTQAIVGVDVKVRKLAGSAHSDITVELFDTYNHEPIMGPLASAAIASSAVGSSWKIVNAPLHFQGLSKGNEYAIVLSQRTLGTSVYEWATARVNSATSFGKWIGNSYVNESALGDGWLKVWTMPPHLGSTVEILVSGIHGNGFGNNTDEIKRYQTFSLAKAATVTGLDLKLRKFSGTGQSDVLAELYAASGGRPTGPALASGTLPALQVGPAWTTVHVPLKSHAMAPGVYAIVLTQRTPAPARYEWAVGQGSPGHAFGKWNGVSWVDETGLGYGWTRLWITDADTDVDLSHASTTGWGFGNFTDELKRFQTFIPPAAGCDAYDITGIQLKLRKVFGQGQTDLVAELHDTASNKPIGYPMSTAVIPADWIGTDWSVVNVPLHLRCDWFGVGIAPGHTYAIVLSQRTAQDARYEWAASPVNSATRFGKWNGTSWIDESSLGDGWLKVSLVARIGPQ